MRIIPAIDIIDGKCVRLSKGNYNTKKVYSENPLDMAKQFEDAGITYLHLVDLDGAKQGRIINYKTLEQIAANTNLQIDFGGGLKTNEDLKIAFECGAKQITGGSIAVKDKATFMQWLDLYGSERIILGADCYQEKIALHGWQEQSEMEVIPFIQDYQAQGIETVICTDISKDGMLEGPSYDLYKRILNSTLFKAQVPDAKALKLIASGGVSTFEELPKLHTLGCEAVIIGKAIYENRITLKQLENFILDAN